jgi:ABC-type Fe3+ transport system permease subunit
MPVWAWLADSSGALLALLLLYTVALLVRRRWISRNGGTFELSVRVRPGRAGRGWILGVARYTDDGLE